MIKILNGRQDLHKGAVIYRVLCATNLAIKSIYISNLPRRKSLEYTNKNSNRYHVLSTLYMHFYLNITTSLTRSIIIFIDGETQA